MNTVKPISNVWLYQGKASSVSIAVDPAPKVGGGYVIALTLSNGNIRLAASRDPARYVSQIIKTIDSLGGEVKASKILVSRRHSRYEAIKRWVGHELADYRVGPDTYAAPLPIVSRKLTEAVTTAKRGFG